MFKNNLFIKIVLSSFIFIIISALILNTVTNTKTIFIDTVLTEYRCQWKANYSETTYDFEDSHWETDYWIENISEEFFVKTKNGVLDYAKADSIIDYRCLPPPKYNYDTQYLDNIYLDETISYYIIHNNKKYEIDAHLYITAIKHLQDSVNIVFNGFNRITKIE